MIFKPHPLSTSQLPAPELEEDRKSCRKVGPCGIGKKAIYLNSFYVTGAIIFLLRRSDASLNAWL